MHLRNLSRLRVAFALFVSCFVLGCATAVPFPAMGVDFGSRTFQYTEKVRMIALPNGLKVLLVPDKNT